MVLPNLNCILINARVLPKGLRHSPSNGERQIAGCQGQGSGLIKVTRMRGFLRELRRQQSQRGAKAGRGEAGHLAEP